MTGSVITDTSTTIVLASASPRRVELLNNLGLVFETVASGIEEDIPPLKTASETVIELARQKARHVLAELEKKENASPKSASSERGKLIVLGADTTVVLDNRMIGKPESKEEAVETLRALSARRHDVFTGVCLLLKNPDGTVSEVSSFEMTHVFFRKLQDSEIEAYVETGEPMDKAGAYALQGIGAAFVQKIDGCFTNVIGLPIPLVVSMFRRANISVLGAAGR